MQKNGFYMKLSYLLLMSTYMVQLSSNAHAGKIDLIPGEEPGYEKNINVTRNIKHTLPYKPDRASTPSLLCPETMLDPENDRRFRIHQTSEWPYSVIGRIKSTFPTNQGRGTGILIGPHHLLTAAHCVSTYQSTDPWANKVTVQLGLNETDAPFGTQRVKEVYTFDEWDQSRDMDYDVALLVLEKSVGLTTGWSGLKVLKDTDLQAQDITVRGYPGDKSRKCNQLWGMTGKINSLQDDRLFYDLDTNKGQSGSGITIDQSEEPYTIGIHTHGTEDPAIGNSGVYLSQRKFNQIIQWMSESCTISDCAAPVISPEPVNPFQVSGLGPGVGKGVMTLCFKEQDEEADHVALVLEFCKTESSELTLEMIHYSQVDDCCWAKDQKVTIEDHDSTVNKVKSSEYQKYASWRLPNNKLQKAHNKAADDQKRDSFYFNDSLKYACKIMEKAGVEVNFSWLRQNTPDHLKDLIDNFEDGGCLDGSIKPKADHHYH